MQLHTEVMALAKLLIQPLVHLAHLLIQKFLCRFRHNNLVQLMGFTKSPPCVVYEFMQNGSLYHNIHEVVYIKFYLNEYTCLLLL